MSYQFIAARKVPPVKWMCRALGVSESGDSAWKRRLPSRREQDDRVLAEQIEQGYQASRRTSGSPRIHVEGRAQGRGSSRNRIARLMRQRSLSARRKRPRPCTTDSQHSSPLAPNRWSRAFPAERPNEKRVADITGVWTSQGWLSLAAVLDSFSRKAIGWAMRPGDLVLAALRMALAQRRPHAGRLHQSDRGSQYTSRDYQGLLRDWGIEVSKSRKGDCYDNAPLGKLLCDRQGRMYRPAALG